MVMSSIPVIHSVCSVPLAENSGCAGRVQERVPTTPTGLTEGITPHTPYRAWAELAWAGELTIPHNVYEKGSGITPNGQTLLDPYQTTTNPVQGI